MGFLKLFMIILFLSTLMSSSAELAVCESTRETGASVIESAEKSVFSAYQAVLEAEQVGANVSNLIGQLNIAGELLAQALILYRTGDLDGAINLSNLCYEMGVAIRAEAHKLRDVTIEAMGQRFRLTVLVSFGFISSIVCVSFFGWRAFERRYHRKILRMRLEVGSNES